MMDWYAHWLDYHERYVLLELLGGALRSPSAGSALPRERSRLFTCRCSGVFPVRAVWSECVVSDQVTIISTPHLGSSLRQVLTGRQYRGLLTPCVNCRTGLRLRVVRHQILRSFVGQLAISGAKWAKKSEQSKGRSYTSVQDLAQLNKT
jgi:hypothetical protein